MIRLATIGAIAAVATSCSKVPLTDVSAQFAVADAAWFEEEDTLFLFWNVEAEQGLGDFSVVEVRYITDHDRLDWTAVSDLATVHSHDTVDCGPRTHCGSTSLQLSSEPRDVQLRLRYHRDGELILDTATAFNVVGDGDAHTHRSLVLYGVFDETNTFVQWRVRHNFPTLRNDDAVRFGLRRYFAIDTTFYGTSNLATRSNIYGYGVACPELFKDSGQERIATTDRAFFHPDPLPVESGSASVICAEATVIDGTGFFTTGAIARKNPEVRSAFPVLNSPVEEATPLKFMLGPCNTTPASIEHEAMQRQRLQLEQVPTTCIDDVGAPIFVQSLVATFREAIEAERPSGNDMVLVVAVNHDDSEVALAVQEALADVVPAERRRSSPRVAGAFVFDSTQGGFDEPRLESTTLWCPTSGGGEGDDITCPPQADTPDVNIGPVQISELPILPDRDQYLSFLDNFSPEQGGGVQSISYLAPRFSTTAEHIDIGRFGGMTFLNQETIAAGPDDAFSFCAQEQPLPIVLSSPVMRQTAVIANVVEACAAEQLPEAICETAGTGAVGVEGLPAWHAFNGESEYEIGVRWDFPFLLRMEYSTVIAGGATLLGLSVPFGAASPHNSYFGADAWLRQSFPIEHSLTQCRRFCDHPTFDSAGVYQPTVAFRETYESTCYVPAFPSRSDIGFPIDP